MQENAAQTCRTSNASAVRKPFSNADSALAGWHAIAISVPVVQAMRHAKADLAVRIQLFQVLAGSTPAPQA
jgi:hypothetical protein